MASFTSNQKYGWNVKDWRFMQELVYSSDEVRDAVIDAAIKVQADLENNFWDRDGVTEHYGIDFNNHKGRYWRAVVYTRTNQAKSYESEQRNMDRYSAGGADEGDY